MDDPRTRDHNGALVIELAPKEVGDLISTEGLATHDAADCATPPRRRSPRGYRDVAGRPRHQEGQTVHLELTFPPWWLL
jgi:hypothetical protein